MRESRLVKLITSLIFMSEDERGDPDLVCLENLENLIQEDMVNDDQVSRQSFG